MKEFTFTLTFKLNTLLEDSNLENQVDALVGLEREQNISLTFTREAKSGFKALLSAVESIQAVIPDAVLVSATPEVFEFHAAVYSQAL